MSYELAIVRNKIINGLAEQALELIRVELEERIMHIVHELEPELKTWYDVERAANVVQFSVRKP